MEGADCGSSLGFIAAFAWRDRKNIISHEGDILLGHSAVLSHADVSEARVASIIKSK
jgi:hypothetical protein